MSRIHSSNKIAIVPQGGDDGDGHSQQPTMKLMTLIDTMVLNMSASQVLSVLIVALYLVLGIWLKWPHNGHGDGMVMAILIRISNGFGS
jgi:hypothetical protein